jgi:hypothetical protein
LNAFNTSSLLEVKFCNLSTVFSNWKIDTSSKALNTSTNESKVFFSAVCVRPSVDRSRSMATDKGKGSIEK